MAAGEIHMKGENLLIIRGVYAEEYKPPICETCKKEAGIYLSHGRYYCQQHWSANLERHAKEETK